MFSLGIDIGTSGVRSAVVDAKGDVLSTARAAHLKQNDSAINADYWWQAVKNCLISQIKALKDIGLNPQEITAIAVDGTSGSMVLIDENAMPVGPALMYHSGGFLKEAAMIAAVAPATHITQGQNSALARLLRLQSLSEHPASATLAHQADFILAKLTGKVGHSDHNNALKTGFDPATENWPDWIEKTGVRVLGLPDVHATGTPLFNLKPDIAAHFGLSPHAIVHAGTTDSIAAFLAVGDFDKGSAVTSLGTTLAVKIISRTRIDDPDVGLYSHKVGDNWLVGGASNSGGGVLLRYFSVDEMTELSKQINPGVPTGLNYYPLLKPGERFPINDPLLEPKLSPRPSSDAAFLQGLYEGMANIELLCYQAIKQRGGPAIKNLYSAGGGASSEVWHAIRARVLNIEPRIAAEQEASVGAAKLCRLPLL